MGHRVRWLAVFLPLAFLGLIFWCARSQDPDFWRSPISLYQSAQEAEERGELAQALRLAENAWSRSRKNSDCGIFLGWLYLKSGDPQKSLAILNQVWSKDKGATAALKGKVHWPASVKRTAAWR
jgi:thioredoxin-like negative regulator of GroEL